MKNSFKALGPISVDKPAKANAKNLETIIRAAKDGALAVMECTLNGNPYELLEPPTP